MTHRFKGAAVTDCNTDNLQHDCAYIVDALTALVLAENYAGTQIGVNLHNILLRKDCTYGQIERL